MNLMNILQDKPRWTTIDKDTWNMILGKMGRLPGTLDPEIIAIAREKGYEFYDGNPQDAFPDELPKYEQMMQENGWAEGSDREELFELAMHERQYLDYRSGVAKERFNRELEDKKAKAGAPVKVIRPVVEMPKSDIDSILAKWPEAKPLQAPAKGQMLWQYEFDGESSAPAVGTVVNVGEPVGYVQTYYGMEEILPVTDGRIVSVCAKQGDRVSKNEIVGFIL